MQSTCLLGITVVYAFCGKWEGWVPVGRFHHNSWMTVVTPTDRPQSFCNELFVAFLCCLFVVEFSVGVRVFCHRNG